MIKWNIVLTQLISNALSLVLVAGGMRLVWKRLKKAFKKDETTAAATVEKDVKSA